MNADPAQTATGFAVVGMGVQGTKRRAIIGHQPCVTVDPVAPGADYISINDVPLERYDAVFLCTPDSVKRELVDYLVGQASSQKPQKMHLVRSMS